MFVKKILTILKSASGISTAKEEIHFRPFLVPLHTVKQPKVTIFSILKVVCTTLLLKLAISIVKWIKNQNFDMFR